MMVSEWMVKGNINEFVKEGIKVDRLVLVCSLLAILTSHPLLTIVWLLQLREVTRGLIYMHYVGVVHGDLKGVSFQITPTPPCRQLTVFTGQHPD